MEFKGVSKFYEEALSKGKFDEDFRKVLKGVTTKPEFKKIFEEKLKPMR